MAIGRDDRWLTDAQGRALAGAQVYWCTQPASTGSNPPSPLATIYSAISGGTTLTQPVLTDGFGHADAYMDNGVLYTVAIWHPLFGANPVVLTDQAIVGGTGGGSGYTPFEAIPSGAINGSNTAFTLTTDGTTPLPNNPVQAVVVKNGQVLTVGLTYTLSGITITFATPPAGPSGDYPGDTINAFGLY